MSLVTMGWRRPPPRPSGNMFGKDDEPRPHDPELEVAAKHDAKEAVARKLLVGCEVTETELDIAGLTREEARMESVRLMQRLDAQHRRLTEPPEPNVYTPGQPDPEVITMAEPEPVSAIADIPNEKPKRRRRHKSKDTRSPFTRAVERKREDDSLFS